jgi:hypothetical protein
MREGHDHEQTQKQNHGALNAAVRADIHRTRKFHAPGTCSDEDGDQTERALIASPKRKIQKVDGAVPPVKLLIADLSVCQILLLAIYRVSG